MKSLLELSLHPGERTLVRIALREPRVPRRVFRHLAACAECRARVAALRGLFDEARDLPLATPHPDLLARIHSRIEAADEVLLPVAEQERSEGRHGTWRQATLLVASAAVAAAALFWVARPSPELTAGDLSGELRLLPDHANPRELDVEYRAPAPLGRAHALVLRARYRSSWDIEYTHETRQIVAARLEHVRGNLFRARVRIPDSTVYAVFAVEDSAATYVDDHHAALWEWMAPRADGQPTFDALHERENDLMGRDMELALQTARRRAALYPDNPAAWGHVAFQEKINLGNTDSLLPRHLARLAALHAKYAGRPDVPFDIVDGMLAYRVQVTDTSTEIGRVVRNYWRPLYLRLVASDTLQSAAGVEARWWALNARAMKGTDSARAVLPAAEALWMNGGSRWKWAARIGTQMARLAKDTGATRVRWVDRYAAVSPDLAAYLYSAELGQVPALRPAAAARLRGVVDALGRADEGRRPLELTRRQGAAADSARARSTLALLADVLIAQADTTGARNALDEATAAGWDAALFRRAADLHLRIGDTAHAIPLLARASSDPSLTATADSINALGRRLAGESRWDTLTARARQAMVENQLSRSIRRRLAEPIVVADADGRKVTLRDIAGGRAVVVAFWSRFCGPSRQQMAQLDSLGARLARQGAVLVPVSDESPSAGTAAFLKEQRVRTPAYYDVSGTASRLLNNFGTPQYYVFDADGVLRFQRSTLDAVLSEVVALTTSRGSRFTESGTGR